MAESKTSKIYDEGRYERQRLMLIEGWALERVKTELEGRKAAIKHRRSIYSWKRDLKRDKICKNFNAEELVYVKFWKDIYSPAKCAWECLVFDGGILLNNNQIEARFQRKKPCVERVAIPKRRDFRFVSIPAHVTALDDPDTFKYFRQLLFHSGIRIESSFKSGKWTKNELGLYARSAELRAELYTLSRLHNLVFDAVREFHGGQLERAGSLIGAALALMNDVVTFEHHRLISDILGIFQLLQNNGLGKVKVLIAQCLSASTKKFLPEHDPARIVVQAMSHLELDRSGDLYAACDTYFRLKWESGAGNVRNEIDQLMIQYCYNQASFPRANPGKFYEFFEGKTPERIQHCLQDTDTLLGSYSREAFCLWHTSMHWLRGQGRLQDMVTFGEELATRINCLGDQEYIHQYPNLISDSALTFLLLGEGYEGMADLENAMASYLRTIENRNLAVPLDAWDPSKVCALKRIRSVATELGAGDVLTMIWCEYTLNKIYTTLKSNLEVAEWHRSLYAQILAILSTLPKGEPF